MTERLIKEKRSAYRAFKRDKSSSSRAVFNQLRNRVTHLLRKSARAHASALHRQLRLTPSSYSSSSFWQRMKRVTGKVKSSVVPDLVGRTFTASSAKEKAQLLNSFFAEQTVLPGANSSTPDKVSVPLHSEKFSSLHCTPAEVTS